MGRGKSKGGTCEVVDYLLVFFGTASPRYRYDLLIIIYWIVIQNETDIYKKYIKTKEQYGFI